MTTTALIEPEMPEREHWTLDRRVPLALIITMVMQFGAIVFWVATLNSAVLSQDKRITALELDNKKSADVLNDVKVLLGRIDERTAGLVDAMHRANDKH